MRYIYTLGILFYTFGVRLAAMFGNVKARQMAAGWKQWPAQVAKLSNDKHTVWFHASSLGEFEQARPVIEEYHRRHPDHQILLSFFSPSGYEIRKDYSEATAICYFPMDTPGNARRFVGATKPVAAYFVKYDFWFNTLIELQKTGCRTYLFSAIFRSNQYFFRPYGKWFCSRLRRCFSHIYVQDDESLRLLISHGITRCSRAGDTRFDRVHQIALKAEPDERVARFVEGTDKVIIAGSSWEPDEQLIALYIKDSQLSIKLILAPHVISNDHISHIETLFPDSIRYSRFDADFHNQRVLIIDNIGMLSRLYRYADVAYIGGGFGHGIHNILEAITFGKPVVFGPRYRKFKEACDIIALGGGFCHHNIDELSAHLTPLLTDPSQYNQAVEICKAYMKNNLSSTEKVLS